MINIPHHYDMLLKDTFKCLDESNDEHSSQSEVSPAIDKMQSKIQFIKAQLVALQEQLQKSRDELKAAQEEVEPVKTQAVIEIKEIKRQAAEQLALNKFGLKRFHTDNDSIKFSTDFPS